MAEVERPVRREVEPVETLEGAGVKLHRVFGHPDVSLLDPFLLLDNFRSTDPSDYVRGFPWHPHRGIETVTYMLDGRVEHGDTLGNSGAIDSGDVQWMSSGSGILHQEMPTPKEGLFEGFQLWVNVPARLKMSNPAYRGLRAREIPVARPSEGTTVKVIAGRYAGVDGPVEHLPVDPTYLDVTLEPSVEFEHALPKGYTAFAYLVRGSAGFGPRPTGTVGEHRAVVFGEGERAVARAGPEGARFLLVAGRPLREPVAWWGPIVMNRPEEISEALVELRRGGFVRDRRPVVEE